MLKDSKGVKKCFVQKKWEAKRYMLDIVPFNAPRFRAPSTSVIVFNDFRDPGTKYVAIIAPCGQR